MELQAGQRVGEYVLEAPLGAGGGGTVWSARHAMIRSKRVALKLPHDETQLAWLRREGMIQAQLDHKNIVKVFGGDLDGALPYIAMELVEGRDLRAALDNGPLDPVRTRAVARGILAALDVAHTAGIVHGDLKPENVLIASDGSVKLSDFGLAHGFLGAELQHSLASSRPKIAGTLRYVPPELLESGVPSTKTDLYSFGVLLFELLVGRVPQGLEGLSDHGVRAPDLERLFRSCYVPESRRLASARAGLAMIAVDLGEEPTRALKSLAEAPDPKGRLIAKRKKESPGFFARFFGKTNTPTAEPTVKRAAPKLKRPPPRPARRRRRSSTREILEQFQGRFVSVATERAQRGAWVWCRAEEGVDPDAPILAMDLSGCRAITRADFERIGGLDSLLSLDLSECDVDDAGLSALAGLSSLTYLSLRGCGRLSDQGLGHLRALRNLNSLDLTSCSRVSDAGVRALRPLRALKFLFLDGCPKVSDAAVEDLKGHAPLQWVSH